MHFIDWLHLIQALADCVDDLLGPFYNDTIDIVAGIDAMGFILGNNTFLKHAVFNAGYN